jgi:hypothetical protein
MSYYPKALSIEQADLTIKINNSRRVRVRIFKDLGPLIQLAPNPEYITLSEVDHILSEVNALVDALSDSYGQFRENRAKGK